MKRFFPTKTSGTFLDKALAQAMQYRVVRGSVHYGLACLIGYNLGIGCSSRAGKSVHNPEGNLAASFVLLAATFKLFTLSPLIKTSMFAFSAGIAKGDMAQYLRNAVGKKAQQNQEDILVDALIPAQVKDESKVKARQKIHIDEPEVTTHRFG